MAESSRAHDGRSTNGARWSIVLQSHSQRLQPFTGCHWQRTEVRAGSERVEDSLEQLHFGCWQQCLSRADFILAWDISQLLVIMSLWGLFCQSICLASALSCLNPASVYFLRAITTRFLTQGLLINADGINYKKKVCLFFMSVEETWKQKCGEKAACLFLAAPK